MDGRSLAVARLREDRTLAVTCALLLVLVAVGVAGLLALDAGSRDAAVRSRIEQLPPERASLTLATSTAEPVPAEGVASGEQDRAVREDVERGLGDLPATVRAAARSDQLAVPGSTSPAAASVVLLVAEDLPDLAALVDGDWAAADDEVALQADAAAALGVQVGGPLVVATAAGERSLVVSGTWRVRPGARAAVGGDPLLLTGRQSTSAVGPAVPADPALLGDATRTWWVAPDVDGLDLESARRLPRAAQVVVDTVRADPRLPAARTSTGLVEDLPAVVRAAGAAGATGRVVLLLVAVVALTAVLVVASLLVERRSGHTALLRSRGASWPQVVGSTLVETGVLLLPALVVAVVAAVAVPGLRPTALPLAATALVAAAVLALPAVLAARRWEAVRENASGRRSAAARVGGELVVVAGAGLALWQLRRQGGATTVQDGGLLDRADLVVVAAPVLGLLAGALVAARLVQPVSALAARVLARRPGLPALVAAWQTSRAPGPYAVAVLLVVVLVGTGVLVTGTASTRSAEISRVAAEQVGADVRVSTDRPLGANPAESARQAAALAGVEGIEQVTGVLVEPASTSAGPVQVVARTSEPAAAQDGAALTVRGGGDLRASWEVVVRASGALPPGVPVDQGPPPAPGALAVSASTWWLAASGYPLRLDLGTVAVTSVLDDVVTAGVEAGLALPDPPGGPDDSWRLVALDADVSGLGTASTEVEVRLAGLDGPDGPVALTGSAWSALGAEVAPTGAPAGEQPGLLLASPSFSGASATGRLLASDVAAAGAAPVPARVGRELLRAAGATVGDALLVRRVQPLSSEVVGTVAGAPGVGDDVVVVDQRTLAQVDLADGRDPSGPGQWEVALPGGSGSAERAAASERVREAATGTGLPVRVVDRDLLEVELADDPLSSGALRTGVLGGTVVALLALVGLLAAGAVSARRRLRDDTVLAVLGADARQQRRAEAVRTLLVGALAVLAGLVTGWVVLVLTGPALVGDPTALGRPAQVPASVPVAVVAVVALVGALLAAVPALVRDPAARSTVAARMRFEEAA
jgi:hypothetical protein